MFVSKSFYNTTQMTKLLHLCPLRLVILNKRNLSTAQCLTNGEIHYKSEFRQMLVS